MRCSVLHYAPADEDAALIDAAFGSGTNSSTKLSVATSTQTNSHQHKAA